ncbi:MAG: YebC/PmpR family DNA-binding transcriptional regulator [Bacteroidales bacterium]|nr:YebC/PmpR family DNA-binding transcriptional regulator [Bacteroidales bacterium]
MSGHSKWSTIKRKKGAIDAKRSKIFSRISKEITIAVKEGGGNDPDMNPRLRSAIQNAKGANMPKDVIQRAITKGEGGGENYAEVSFEGTGPGGVAIFVECLTDNNQRTVSNVRSAFNKRGGILGKNGSLSFLFDRKGIFTIPFGSFDVEEIELELIDAGLEEIEVAEDHIIITTALEDFGSMQKKLEEMNIDVENAELQRIPNARKTVDVDTAKKALKLIEMIEDDDDVQNVFHDLEMTDELEAALEE